MKGTGVPDHRKGFRRSDGFRRLKLAAKRLVGREPRLKADIDVPLERLDDWWICLPMLPENAVVYAFGIGEDLGFEREILRRKRVDVFAFDPTPNTVDWLATQSVPDRFHHRPWAIADRDGIWRLYPRVGKDGAESRVMHTMMPDPGNASAGVEIQARTLGSIMQMLGHAHVDVLKLDIEGAEYSVLENLLASPLRPAQVMVEFHHRFHAIGKQKTVDAISAMRNAGYGLARISSSGREFTLILKSAASALGVMADVRP